MFFAARALAARALAALLLLVVALPTPAAAQANAPVIGRWDIAITSGARRIPSWLEVTLSGNRTLVGRFVHGGGSARPVAKVDFVNGTMRFVLPPQWDRGNADLTFEGKLDGPDRLSGTMTTAEGETLSWTASRAPTLRRATTPSWGAPVPLFNGRDLAGWTPVGGANAWSAVNGVLVNARGGANLVTAATYSDFKLHAEFRYPKGGNSGIYLRGRYEVQIEDSTEPEPRPIDLGGIYGFLAPNQNVARGPGVWQTIDVTLIGRTVTVVLNGRTVICDAIIPGITGGALDSDEGAPGPIYLQGDHGPVEFRNLVITPVRPGAAAR